MRVFLLEAPGRAVMQEIPVRALKPDELLIKVRYAGICGTDLSFYSGNSDFVRRGLVRYPVRIGHEWSGIVEEVGPLVTGFSPGDAVIGDNGVSCGQCADCHSGNWRECRHGYSVGTLNCWDGCFADYIIMPLRHVYHIPLGVSLEQACLIEPATIPYNALRQLPVKGGMVVVIGTGPIGLSGVALARQQGAKRVVLVGRTPAKLDIGLEMGADEALNTGETEPVARILELTGGAGADLVLEASGVLENIWLGLRMTARRGHLGLLAFYECAFGDYAIDQFTEREVSLFGVMGAYGAPADVAEIIAAGMDLMPMVTHRIDFAQMEAVFPKISEMRNRVKILVKM